MVDYNWYLNAKNSYPDAIIFMRIGELYRTYGEDAMVISEILNIAPPSLDLDESVDTIWIPCSIIENYVKKLIQAGRRVVLIEPISKAQR